MRNSISIVNNATAISTDVIGGETFVNLNGRKFQVKKGQVSFPAAATATNAGTKGTGIVTFGGTYAVGEQVRVTVSLPHSGQQLIKSYVHTVVAGGTATTAIATAVAALITADISAGLEGLDSAIAGGSAVTLTQTSVTKQVIGGTTPVNLVAYTDSAAGTAVVTGTDVVIAQGTPAIIEAEGVDPDEIGLASYSTVLLKAKVDGAFPFIDSDGKTITEIKFYSTPAITAALIAAL